MSITDKVTERFLARHADTVTLNKRDDPDGFSLYRAGDSVFLKPNAAMALSKGPLPMNVILLAAIIREAGWLMQGGLQLPMAGANGIDPLSALAEMTAKKVLVIVKARKSKMGSDR